MKDEDMVLVDPQLVGYLTIKSGIRDLDEFEKYKVDPTILKAPKAPILKAANKTLTFKPNPTLGEGKASKEELQYRQYLLLYVKQMYDAIKKIKNGNELIDAKILAIDKIIDTFIINSKTLVQNTVTARYKGGYNKLGEMIQKFKPSMIPIMEKDQPRLAAILKQQLMNIEDIGLTYRGRVRQLLLMREISNYYYGPKKNPQLVKQAAVPDATWNNCMIELQRTHPEMNEEDLRNACEESEDDGALDNQTGAVVGRTDQLGMYGYLQSYTAGFMQSGITVEKALMAGNITMLGLGVVSNMLMKIPWVTCEDNGNCSSDTPVCGACLDAKANGPYMPEDFPDDQHMGERCNDPPGQPVLDVSNVGGDIMDRIGTIIKTEGLKEVELDTVEGLVLGAA